MPTTKEVSAARAVLKKLKTLPPTLASTRAWVEAVTTAAMGMGYLRIKFCLKPWDGGFSGHVEAFYDGKEPRAGICECGLWSLLRGDYDDHVTPRMGCGNGSGGYLKRLSSHQAQVTSKWPLPSIYKDGVVVSSPKLDADRAARCIGPFIRDVVVTCSSCDAKFVELDIEYTAKKSVVYGVCDSCSQGDN